jgi:chorismate dehydratase
MTTTTEISSSTLLARVPFLNSAPFFDGPVLDGFRSIEAVLRELGRQAAAGSVTAGLLPVADFLRLQDRFERLGNLGIAVRGRCGSVLLLSRVPMRQLGGCTIQVTEQSSTSVVLLRLILEQRYELAPRAYESGISEDADAILVIGDEALRRRAGNRQFPYEIDLAFEWWLWQHLPAVFAVWAVRTDAPAADKQQLLRALHRQLAVNVPRAGELAAARAADLGVPAEELTAYLENFIYRLSEPEEQAIRQFATLAHEHHLL